MSAPVQLLPVLQAARGTQKAQAIPFVGIPANVLITPSYQWNWGGGYSAIYKQWPAGQTITIDGGPTVGRLSFTVDQNAPANVSTVQSGIFPDSVAVQGVGLNQKPTVTVNLSSATRATKRIPLPSGYSAARGRRLSFDIVGQAAAGSQSGVAAELHSLLADIYEEPNR